MCTVPNTRLCLLTNVPGLTDSTPTAPGQGLWWATLGPPFMLRWTYALQYQMGRCGEEEALCKST